jgi:ABC-type glycerol-3-phosphate transport system substrate-binding protein
MFSNASISVVPKFWSEFYDLAARLTVKDTNLNITKSAFSLGEYSNVTNANEIISLLIMQAGSPITARREDGRGINNLLNQRLNFPVTPAELAVNFYTEFSNPLKSFYSWNRAMPDSKSMFLSGDLALYFGFASELADLRLKNPNLNFDVAAMPQTKNSERTITFGRMVGLAITKNSKNIAGAYQVVGKLTSQQSIQSLHELTNLPPVRRDLLARRPAEAFMTVFYDGAIQSRAWLSPETARVQPIFKEMIESVTAGRASIAQVLSRASQQLGVALDRN